MHTRPQNRAKVHVPVYSRYYFLAGKEVSNCILCLKYFAYEGGIFPNRWSEYFENTTHTKSKKIGLPFVYTLKTTSVCAPWMTKSKYILCLKYLTYEEGIFPNHWSEYFEHSTRTICELAEKHFGLCNFLAEWRSSPESSVWNTSLMNELFFTLTEVIFLSFKC